MKTRAFCGMTLMAGAAASLPIGRLIAAPGASSPPEPADLRAVKLSGAETTIDRAAVRDFRSSLGGPSTSPSTAMKFLCGVLSAVLLAGCATESSVVMPATLRTAVRQKSTAVLFTDGFDGSCEVWCVESSPDKANRTHIPFAIAIHGMRALLSQRFTRRNSPSSDSE